MNLIQAIQTQKTQLSALAVGYALEIMGYVQNLSWKALAHALEFS